MKESAKRRSRTHLYQRTNAQKLLEFLVPSTLYKSLSSHRRVGVSSACPLDYVQCERSHQPRPPWCVTKCDPGSGVLGSDESDPSKQPHLQAPCQQSLHTQLHTLYLSLSFLPLALSPVPCPSTARIGMPIQDAKPTPPQRTRYQIKKNMEISNMPDWKC